MHYQSVSAAPEVLLRPITVPHKVLMGPGPSSSSPRVLAAGSLPLLGHLHSEFVQIMDECKAGIQYLFQTQNKMTLAATATGHGAMEMACGNMVEPGDKVLVATNGIWGSRFTEMVRRHGGCPVIIEKQGKAFTHDEIERALAVNKPQLMFITHSESSSGLLQPVTNLGHLCHKYNCLLIVDSVASAGGVPLFMDKWGIDVLYTGSQKCLSSTPVPSPISFSDRAYQRFLNRKSKPVSYYFDLEALANYWGCDGAPVRRYHHTGAIAAMYSLRESLAVLAEEGLVNSWKRHADCAERLRNGVRRLGLELFIPEPDHRLPTILAIVVPPGVDWKAVSAHFMKKYRLEVSGGLGPTAGKIWRVGLMGYNATLQNVDKFLQVFQESLKLQGYSPSRL
ncbi:alanine--glyoxylate aminotransferase-like [Watersipora subatra]|uniref:alanine--glyoxylate aminotransferase-like n=1 Tax=Watersipora subatra TaxID=2589382 RepID=UPI00355B272D